MGNLGKATSFIDTEGDGDVMPKLVDMLTKVLVVLFMCFGMCSIAYLAFIDAGLQVNICASGGG